MDAIGGLIIFISWIINNTIVQNYNSLKGSVENAQGVFRLYNTLHELKGMNNSIAAEVIRKIPNSNNATRFRAGKHHVREIENLRQTYSETVLNGFQVKSLNQFSNEVYALSKAADTANLADVNSLLGKTASLYSQYSELYNTSQVELNNSNSFASIDEFTELPIFIDKYKNEIHLQIAPLYREITEQANKSTNESSKKLQRLKNKKNMGKIVSSIAYVIGTLIILYDRFK